MVLSVFDGFTEFFWCFFKVFSSRFWLFLVVFKVAWRWSRPGTLQFGLVEVEAECRGFGPPCFLDKHHRLTRRLADHQVMLKRTLKET